uniref:Uncharacterized protein n=1 Tax=Setaria viridis TaxID=4556 RepID=A0A4U6U9G1_SETVI|nr:hypothetical protein SEVIR_6G220701v2 [Setaria viridis]
MQHNENAGRLAAGSWAANSRPRSPKVIPGPREELGRMSSVTVHRLRVSRGGELPLRRRPRTPAPAEPT